MWSNPHPTLLMRKPKGNLKNLTTVIGFDFDSTLVNQPSGKTFAVNADDWQPLYKDIIKEKLVAAAKYAFIVIFTNQNGIEKNQVTVGDVKKRIDNFIEYCGLQDVVWCFAASHSDHFRKPCTGMWDFAMSQFNALPNTDRNLNKNNCLYVGDAAGRFKTKTTKKDFSCSDRTFAFNVGINFMTPEQYFLDAPAPVEGKDWEWEGIDPNDYLHLEKVQLPSSITFEKPTQELVLLIGPPASGKSTFCLEKFPAYTRVNNDTLKTKTKCIKLATESLKAGRSVIIDNTNPSAKARKEYIDLAKSAKVPVRAFVIDTPKELVFHLNSVRVKMTQGETKKIPGVCYNMYFKNFEQPAASEGISETITVPFKLDFKDQTHRKIFMERT